MVRRRRQPVGWRVAEGCTRSGIHARGADPDLGRAVGCAGRQSRVRAVLTLAGAGARPDRDLHLAPLLDSPTRGSDSRVRGGSVDRAGHTCRIARAWGPLCGALQPPGRLVSLTADEVAGRESRRSGAARGGPGGWGAPSKGGGGG